MTNSVSQVQAVRKAVIPVAGLGTRMLPATKAIPKEMLPIADKPLIQYIVAECHAAGINEIVLVTHNSKNSIENHFDTSFELETMLEKRVKRQQLDEVRSICPKGVTIMHVRQGQAKGLGHAILCALPVVGPEPVAIILPDVLIDNRASNLEQHNLAEMIRLYEQTGVSQVMVEPVAEELVSSYGIVNINGHKLKAGKSVPMTAIIEKPEINQAPSNLSVVGRYVLSPTIWDWLEKTPLGAGDEIQLTDTIDLMMAHNPVNAFHITGKSHDCGSKFGYMKAFLEYGVRDERNGKRFTQYLQDFVNHLQ